jgi:hypothetical protein
MNRKVLVLPVLLAVTLAVALVLTACGGQGVPPGSGGTTAVGGGALSVQLTQGPPATMAAGSSVGLFATVFNDKNNAGVTWSCAPAGACGTFSPTTTGYLVDTLYTAPILANGPITPNLNHAITITATSVADSSQSATSTSINLTQQYAIVLYPGNGSFGMVASVTLDGNGNVISGEADGSANGLYWSAPSVTGTYTLDATGHGNLSLSLNNSTCCGTLQQTHGITATSNSHLVIAEEDNFNGLTIGAIGSMDLQAAATGFSGSQVSGGYSFTLAGYSHALGQNGSWGGIFTADGTALGSTPGNISGGIFDENVGNNGGGTGYNAGLTSPATGLPFTGTYTAPDADGRGVITLSSSPDVPGPCGSTPLPACTQYVYYLVTPEVLQLTSMSNVGSAANTGTAFGQGSLATAANDTTALSGGFVFSYYGFGDNNNGGDSGAAAGQFATDGGGNVTSGVMDLNVADGGSPAPSIATTGISLIGSTYVISGSTRGTLTMPSGQNYNVYLTDPNLNLLDPNNTSGGGGALLFEADNPSAPYGNAIGILIPQASPAPAALSGSYAVLLSNQSNLGGCCNYDGGLTGDFTVSTTTTGAFSGEGDFQGTGANNATLITGPLTGTFVANTSNPGQFSGTIVTTPAFPFGIGGTTPGTETVDFFLANGSQGFIIETDALAPIFGAVEVQGTITGAAAAKRPRAQTQHSHPKNLLQMLGEQHTQLDNHAGSGHE